MPTIGPEALASIERLAAAPGAEFLEHHGILPVRREHDRLWVATWLDAVEERVLDDLRVAFGAEPVTVKLPEEEVRETIRRVYGGQASTAQEFIEGMTGTARSSGSNPGGLGRGDPALDDLVSQANEAPVVRLVNMLLLEALEARASDVHLEQYANSLDVRYRIDGVLQPAPSPPYEYVSAVVSRLKIMAELDIAERRLPQDGRLQLRLKERDVDVRVSTIPTLHGESVVLRLLDQREGRIGLEDLGMGSDTRAAFEEVIARPNGIVLTTGPTGSGKTTTLYAALDRIRSGREKVLTVEDPVEYELPGVAQVPVNPGLGLSFSTALRALLRQDPDVLLVGEIRDPETAEIAAHASLTGHLVLSTLHTNDAATALTRLLDLRLEPYLITSTVEAVLAQRLVRTVCPGCRCERPTTADEMNRLPGIPSAVWEGEGCELCRGTGYLGRTGLYEFLLVSDAIRERVHGRSSATEVKAVAVESGMRTLRDDGARLVLRGVTTPVEVLRMT